MYNYKTNEGAYNNMLDDESYKPIRNKATLNELYDIYIGLFIDGLDSVNLSNFKVRHDETPAQTVNHYYQCLKSSGVQDSSCFGYELLILLQYSKYKHLVKYIDVTYASIPIDNPNLNPVALDVKFI
ncbi:unnamed protein product [Cunninghamella blakesleeana]